MRQLIVSDPTSGTTLQFPNLPKRIGYSHGVTETSIPLDDFGTASWPNGRTPTVVSFEGTFYGGDRAAAAWVTYWRPPIDCIAQLQDWHDLQYQARRKLQLTLTDSELAMDVYLSSFEHNDVGAMGDITYRLEFKEWRQVLVGLDTPGIPTPAGGVAVSEAVVDSEQTDPDTPAIPSTYTVKPGDFLITIAKQQLGNSALWRDIYELNLDVIGGDPDFILPGQVLALPGGQGGDAVGEGLLLGVQG